MDRGIIKNWYNGFTSFGWLCIDLFACAFAMTGSAEKAQKQCHQKQYQTKTNKQNSSNNNKNAHTFYAIAERNESLMKNKSHTDKWKCCWKTVIHTNVLCCARVFLSS